MTVGGFVGYYRHVEWRVVILVLCVRIRSSVQQGRDNGGVLVLGGCRVQVSFPIHVPCAGIRSCFQQSRDGGRVFVNRCSPTQGCLT